MIILRLVDLDWPASLQVRRVGWFDRHLLRKKERRWTATLEFMTRFWCKSQKLTGKKKKLRELIQEAPVSKARVSIGAHSQGQHTDLLFQMDSPL